MYAAEVASRGLSGVAAYYSLVVREPYIVGRLPSCDLVLPSPEVAAQHATLAVMRQSEAVAVMATGTSSYEAAEAGATSCPAQSSPPKPSTFASISRGTSAWVNGATPLDRELAQQEGRKLGDNVADRVLYETDPLVVLLQVCASGASNEPLVFVNGASVGAGASVILCDGTVVQLGSNVSVIFRYRPLIVSVALDSMSADATTELTQVFHSLGATLTDQLGPTPFTATPTPIGLLHCVSELNDSSTCLLALAVGYSIVSPGYVIEWFAALARSASSPLSTLPPPSSCEVPIRCTKGTTAARYLRPESDHHPYSLYPIPTTATTYRSRNRLFAGKIAILLSSMMVDRYRLVLQLCGAIVVLPGETEALWRLLLQEGGKWNGQGLDYDVSQRCSLPEAYILIDSMTEARVLEQGLHADKKLQQLFEEAKENGADNRLYLLSDHDVFTALLTNTFHSPTSSLASFRPSRSATGCAAGRSVVYELYQQQRADQPTLSNPRSSGRGRQMSRGQSSARLPSAVAESSISLTRVTVNNGTADHLGVAPSSRSPLLRSASAISCSRAKLAKRSSSISNSHIRPSSPQTPSTSPVCRGRRHLVPFSSQVYSMTERFDALRMRIYVFLTREEPHLDACIASARRNRFTAVAAMEHAVACRHTAKSFMHKVDELLAADGAKTFSDALRRFWHDCSDMDLKARTVIAYWEKQNDRQRSRLPGRSISPVFRSAHGQQSKECSLLGHTPGADNGAPTANSPSLAPTNHPEILSCSRPQTSRLSLRGHRGSYRHLDTHRRRTTSSPRAGSVTPVSFCTEKRVGIGSKLSHESSLEAGCDHKGSYSGQQGGSNTSSTTRNQVTLTATTDRCRQTPRNAKPTSSPGRSTVSSLSHVTGFSTFHTPEKRRAASPVYCNVADISTQRPVWRW